MSLAEKVGEANEAFASGDYGVALASFEEAILIAISKNQTAALSVLHANKGAVLQRLGKVDESIAALTKSLEYDPKHIEALYNKGVALKARPG